MKGNKMFKTCFAVGAAILSLGAFSTASAEYIGNPNRPDTMWVPGFCKADRCGCHCFKGYYVYFRQHPCCGVPMSYRHGHYNVVGVRYVGYTGSWL